MENTDNAVEQTETVTTPAAETVATPESTPESNVFKAFDTEDQYNKEVQSLSSKAKYSLLQELGVKNLDEVKIRFNELDAAKSELSTLDDIRSELDTLKTEKQTLSETLLVTKMGVKEDTAADFLVLAKSKMASTEDMTLEDAMKATLEKYAQFGGESSTPLSTKIGTEKASKPSSKDYIMEMTKL